MSKTNVHEAEVLELIRGSTHYVGLLSGAPGEDGTGPELVAGTGVGQAPGYTRMVIPLANPPTQGSPTVLRNSGTITFPTNPGPIPWPAVPWFGIFSALTGGVMRRYGPLDVATVINPGQAGAFAPNALTMTED